MLSSCVTIFSALTLLAVIRNRQGSINIEKREWDLQTVTASDYTLEITLSRDQIANMRNAIYQESFAYYDTDGMKLKLFMTRELENILRESGDNNGRIADINFAYYNSWLIDDLVRRGDLIKYQKWDELNKLNSELTENIRAKTEDICTPKCAFVSIESETAYNYLSDYETEGEKGKIILGGLKSTVKEAPEPTNVIWQNRDFDKQVRWIRFIFVCIAVLFVLLLTFLATIQAKAMKNDLIGKYDDSINCQEMSKMYDKEKLSLLAADEWLAFYKNGGEDTGRQISPTLSCFCNA